MTSTFVGRGSPGRPATLVLLGAILTGSAGCGGDDSPTVGRDSGMRLAFTVSPDPIAPEPLAGGRFEWIATYVVTVRESGGVGGSLAGVAMSLDAASGGAEFDTDDDPSETRADADNPRLDPHGTRDIHFVTRYSVPGEGSEALLELLVQIHADDGIRFRERATFLIP